MRSMIFPALVAVLTVAVVAFSPSSAEDHKKGKGMNMPTFADFDLNGDGTITEDEFTKARSERIAERVKAGRKMKNLANAPSFDDIDTDDDDGISPDEFKAHQDEHRAKGHHKKH